MSQELKATHETQLRQMPPFASIPDDRIGAVLEGGQFLQISEGHLLFKRFEPIAVGANQTVINQGDEGDYFYVIKTGRVAIDQTTSEEVKRVAEMGAGSSFGQDALISDAPRNATVTTLESCELMRLSETDFSELLMSPVIEYVTLEEVEAVESMQSKPPVFVDVRSNLELQPLEISDPVKRIPLPMLRDEIKAFEPDPIYLVIGPQRPKIAEVAAYLLNEAGFTAYVINLPD